MLFQIYKILQFSREAYNKMCRFFKFLQKFIPQCFRGMNLKNKFSKTFTNNFPPKSKSAENILRETQS